MNNTTIMNTRTNPAHEELNEDLQWAGMLREYRNELHNMKFRISRLVSTNICCELLGEAISVLKQLNFQLGNLEEIAHIVRRNEYILISKLSGHTTAADHHRQASRIKEQSLLRAFGNSFNRLREQYDLLCRRPEVSAA